MTLSRPLPAPPLARRLAAWLAAAALCGPLAAVAAEFRDLRPEEVSVVFGSEQIEITLDALAPVNLSHAWSVLTDFEHMSQFLPSLDLSEVSSRQGNELRVHQHGSTRVGLLRFDYENVRDISLTPQRLITARGVSGDFKRLDTRTELSRRDGGVQLHYHALVEPAHPLPAFLGQGPLRRQTAENFSAFIREMIRRQESAAPPTPALANGPDVEPGAARATKPSGTSP